MWQIVEMDRLHVKRIHLVGYSYIDIIDEVSGSPSNPNKR
jgi:hypothetical protein